MLNILDRTYRSTPFHSIIARLGDCWGSCCINDPKPSDIKQKRCGHRLNWLDKIQKDALIALLEEEAAYISKSKRLIKILKEPLLVQE